MSDSILYLEDFDRPVSTVIRSDLPKIGDSKRFTQWPDEIRRNMTFLHSRKEKYKLTAINEYDRDSRQWMYHEPVIVIEIATMRDENGNEERWEVWDDLI